MVAMLSVLLLIGFFIFPIIGADNPDIYLPTTGIVRRHGYPAETHTIQTEDGYLLGLHRIPHGKIQKNQKTRPVVFLQHGLLSSSADWVLTGPEKGLGFLLADRGYDVWMGNSRGNSYSRAHITLKPSDQQFWNFSWDQMAKYDLPAEIDHILEITGQSNLTYIGHSMGTTMFFALTSSRPEFNSKIKIMLAFAPVAFVSHMKSPLRLLEPWINDLEYLERILGKGELLPQSKIIEFLAKYLCDKGNVGETVCANFLFVLAGYDKPQLNETILPVILSHNPAGTSTRTVVQYAQQIKSDQFSAFDFGAALNRQIYNSTNPPIYPLEQITTPIALFYSNNDLFVSSVDLDKLMVKLTNVVHKYEVPYKAFNHLDFIYAVDAPTLLYGDVFRILEKFSRNGESQTKLGNSFYNVIFS